MKLECRNVSFSWQRGNQPPVEAAHNVSFGVNRGEIVVLIGPSGCGKTTLLRLIAGLQRQAEGEILVDGQPIEGPSAKRGMIFQSPNLFPWLSVQKNIEFGPRMKRTTSETRAQAAERLLKQLGLYDWRNHNPQELSGGMQQRAALAQTLINEPDILLVDEPLTSIDRQTRIQMMRQFLLHEHTKSNLTVVYVTHFVDEAILFADRILLMSARPATVLEEVVIGLEHPRDATSPDFYSHWLYLTQRLEEQVKKTYDTDLPFDPDMSGPGDMALSKPPPEIHR